MLRFSGGSQGEEPNELVQTLRDLGSCMWCCKRDDMQEDDPNEGFSNNIYKEMSIADLKSEYKRIKNEKYKFRAHVLKNRLPKDQIQYYIERME
jgi:hypothetical protein